MRRTTTTIAAIATCAALALTGCSSSGDDAAAEDWPTAGTTIDWIVPSAPGAGNDILARLLAPVMADDLGATINVVNVEGGNQVIGIDQLANADPDGETVGFTNIPSILGRYLDPGQQASFDRESFIPVGSFASNDVVIGVPADSPYETVEELFDAVDDDPGALSFATDSRGGDDHVNLRILEDELDLDFNIVHYNSGADKVAAVVAGEVDAALGGVSSFFGQAQAGDLRILAVISDEPSPFLDDVPTLASAGYEVDPMQSRFTISVPAGTPDEILEALQTSLRVAAEDPEVVEALEGAATQPGWLDSEGVSALWEEREAAVEPIIAEILADQS